jgi:hypothetical protein
MEKTVRNMKAHFFNKRKATWDKAKGAGPQEQEPQGKGYRTRGNWGEQGWGKPEGGKGYQGGWGNQKKKIGGKADGRHRRTKERETLANRKTTVVTHKIPSGQTTGGTTPSKKIRSK